jgi:LacI family transcriptional regulator
VSGFDGIPAAAAMFPAVTTIAQPIAELGTLGLRLILDRIGHPEAQTQRILLATELIVRESTSRPADCRA